MTQTATISTRDIEYYFSVFRDSKEMGEESRNIAEMLSAFPFLFPLLELIDNPMIQNDIFAAPSETVRGDPQSSSHDKLD